MPEKEIKIPVETQPLQVTIEAGEIVMITPTLASSLTPDAADATADRLREAAARVRAS